MRRACKKKGKASVDEGEEIHGAVGLALNYFLMCMTLEAKTGHMMTSTGA